MGARGWQNEQTSRRGLPTLPPITHYSKPVNPVNANRLGVVALTCWDTHTSSIFRPCFREPLFLRVLRRMPAFPRPPRLASCRQHGRLVSFYRNARALRLRRISQVASRRRVPALALGASWEMNVL